MYIFVCMYCSAADWYTRFMFMMYIWSICVVWVLRSVVNCRAKNTCKDKDKDRDKEDTIRYRTLGIAIHGTLLYPDEQAMHPRSLLGTSSITTSCSYVGSGRYILHKTKRKLSFDDSIRLGWMDGVVASYLCSGWKLPRKEGPAQNTIHPTVYPV
jgi:hypothetical protein